MWGQPPPAVRGEQSSPAAAQCKASAAGTKSKSQRRLGGSSDHRIGRSPAPAHHHRPKYRRKNSSPENRRPPVLNGPVPPPSPCPPRRAPPLRARPSRHRRLSVDRAESFHLLPPPHQYRFPLPHRDGLLSSAARLVSLR